MKVARIELVVDKVQIGLSHASIKTHIYESNSLLAPIINANLRGKLEKSWNRLI